MKFYLVIAAHNSFHGLTPLTYHYGQVLQPGTLVAIPLKSITAVGIIVKETSKPAFSTKSITSVIDQTPLPPQSLKFLDWLRFYYPAPLGLTAQQLLPPGLLKNSRSRSEVALLDKVHDLPPLTTEQLQVLSAIDPEHGSTYLLHGETGSGKTRIYIELIRRTLLKQQSSLILVPEIGLTTQLLQHIESAFNQEVLVLHSNISESLRKSTWLKVHNAKSPVIVIGTRSALFAPFHDLGFIAVDESHDPAYKQEQAPNYYALRVAATLSKLHDALIIYGSATPLVSEYYMAESKKVPILRMNKIAKQILAEPPEIKIVDLKERNQFTRKPHISDTLIKSMEQTLLKNEQVLLFLNRRGTARLVLCQACGWQALCSTCDLPYVYHGDSHTLKCHTCGTTISANSSCPTCRSTDIVFRSAGTKAIVNEVQALFPQARIQRFDTDNKHADRIEQQYDSIKNGEVDVLIGTQMLTKGLDLPNLGLVGVVMADTSLSFPDYTALEKTYQMVYQVLGRIGRGHRNGKAVIQTYNPNSLPITSAVNKDWELFYKHELREREQFMFPPYCFILKLTCERKSSSSAEKSAMLFAEKLRLKKLSVQIIGPAPSFQEKQGDNYRWQVIIKSKSRPELLKVINLLPSGWSHDIDPIHLL